ERVHRSRPGNGLLHGDVVHSASCSTVLVPRDAEGTGFCVYLYFPPKVGKFGGFAGVATWTP
ncbi:MAG: hypothetical protein MJ138_08275, partial [Kiritimatiellae bacterium]|nr:hypothetical protein [Kiritimatiellia bacterium]